MEDRVPGFSLGPEQQSSQHRGQQAIVNAVIYVFTLLEQNSTHTNKCKARHQKACTLFLDEILPTRKYLGTNKRHNCIRFRVATQTPGVETPDSRPRCGRRPWDVVISATKAKTCTSCPAEYPSKLIFMQTKNPNLSGKRYIFPRDLNPPAVSVTVCWPQNILQCISHSCMKGSTIWNLNGLCDSAHLTQGWGLQSN